MRVLETIPQMGVGGAERVVIDLLRGLSDRSHAVGLAAAPGPLDALIEVPSLHRVELRERARSPFALPATVLRQGQSVTRFRPDVVHAHGVRVAATASLALRAVGRRSRTPLVVTFHGVVSEEYRVSARILSLVDHVVTVSAELAESLASEGYPERRLSVIPNGVGRPPPVPAADKAALEADLGAGDGCLITAVGRLVPEKAHWRLLEAARIVRRSHPQARFAIVGDGVLREELESRARELALDGTVSFLGTRMDARAIVSVSDIVVFSSDSEGMSIAALEAMAASVPVVSTPAPGMTELLAGHSGIVVGDHEPETLARGLIELIDSAARRAEMGAAGERLIAERHSVDAMVAAYERLFGSVAPRKLIARG